MIGSFFASLLCDVIFGQKNVATVSVSIFYTTSDHFYSVCIHYVSV